MAKRKPRKRKGERHPRYTWRPVVHPLTWEVIRLNEDGSISHHSYASTEAAAKEMAEIMDEAVQPGKFKEYLNVVTP